MFEDLSKVLLLTDMDGTLLSADKTISAVNLAAIERFRMAGGKFALATGRVIQATAQYFEQTALDGPIIICNGSMIYDCGSGEVKWQQTLPEDKARFVVAKLLERFPEASAEINTPFTAYVVQCNETSVYHRKIAGMTSVEEVASLKDVPKGSWNKVLFAMESRLVGEFASYAQTIEYCGDFEFVTSGEIFHEMLPLNCSKGDAMKRLVSLYGLEDHTVVAMGDYNNDIRMLELADFSACPSTAVEDVKAVSDMICKSGCDSAVAEVIGFMMNRKD